MDGGSGDDLLTGSETVADELTGGPGSDRLFGRGGDDQLLDGDLGSADADHYDGGSGRDIVDYSARRAGVFIDLTSGSSGRAGEGDQLVGVEDARGGGGADRIVGDADANSLTGSTGDLVEGRGGPDRLTVDPRGGGHPRLMGGSGDDVFDLVAGNGGTIVSGGSGSDRVDLPSPRDSVDRAVERVRGFDADVRVDARHRRLRVSSSQSGALVLVRVESGDALRTVARARIRRAGRAVTVPLNRSRRRVVVDVRSAAGTSSRSRFFLRL